MAGGSTIAITTTTGEKVEVDTDTLMDGIEDALGVPHTIPAAELYGPKMLEYWNRLRRVRYMLQSPELVRKQRLV